MGKLGSSKVTVTIELAAHTRRAIDAFLTTTRKGAAEPAAAELNSHGPLDLQKLVAMLLEDVALMVHRPGSWEGANMLQVMSSHGYADGLNDPACLQVRSEYWGGKDPYADHWGKLK